MQFMYGCTRWVFLTKSYAVKIARFRPIKPFIRFLYLFKKGEVIEKFEQHDSNLTNLIKAVLKYVCVGILANRNEHRLYKKYGSELLVPTLFTIFWLVNVQRRGEPSGEKEMHRHRLWYIVERERDVLFAEDILHPKQFCVIGGITYLADYGNEVLESFLDICQK